MADILVVDDAAFLRKMLGDILIAMGHRIVGEASDGETAVQLYKKLSPDLVTMDITMPEMDGIEALKRIRSYDLCAKVVICSAMGQQNMVIDAIYAGAKDFIVKPFSTDRVQAAVAKVLEP
ncbi:response regulator [Paenibacillus doosanensis]|uniref:Chemotaxis protein CheY n=1 Tax=Paenibacillus konkukensis TaxID=2020716 RepID=A0ABY4RQ75_9BACL|nr:MULTISPECIES: response regulator [Paenibacillus]MCS7462949.1 response regulator [Paenibacillus doosanensis]UQZ83854.1 Chemotaxis protein CheY [Paenibacillus konkukensis]